MGLNDRVIVHNTVRAIFVISVKKEKPKPEEHSVLLRQTQIIFGSSIPKVFQTPS